MQLPPTDFFSAKRSGDDDDMLIDEQGELVRYDLTSNSFLNHAAKNLPSTMLGWHYRSRSESLISFSNWTFYDGRLLTVPDQQLLPAGCGPIEARACRGRSSRRGGPAPAAGQFPLHAARRL
jgi:superfamily I DNA and/or RNA helicase